MLLVQRLRLGEYIFQPSEPCIWLWFCPPCPSQKPSVFLDSIWCLNCCSVTPPRDPVPDGRIHKMDPCHSHYLFLDLNTNII